MGVDFNALRHSIQGELVLGGLNCLLSNDPFPIDLITDIIFANYCLVNNR